MDGVTPPGALIGGAALAMAFLGGTQVSRPPKIYPLYGPPERHHYEPVCIPLDAAGNGEAAYGEVTIRVRKDGNALAVGAATTAGDDSPAITGSGNTVVIDGRPVEP